MKRNLRNLALMAIIAALTMFPAVVMAWGDDYYHNNSILGEYYVTGGGPCVLAPWGFNDALQPKDPADALGPWSMSDNTWEGVYSFKPNGKGTFKAIYRVVDRPSSFWILSLTPDSGNDIPNGAAAEISWDFKYTVSERGRITFTYEKGSYIGIWTYGPQVQTPFNMLYLYIDGPYYGVLSGNNIVVSWGVPLQLMVTADQANEIPLFPLICNSVQQGFRCHGKCPELVY